MENHDQISIPASHLQYGFKVINALLKFFERQLVHTFKATTSKIVTRRAM